VGLFFNTPPNAFIFVDDRNLTFLGPEKQANIGSLGMRRRSSLHSLQHRWSESAANVSFAYARVRIGVALVLFVFLSLYQCARSKREGAQRLEKLNEWGKAADALPGNTP
jgi:hypothetical protein